VPFSLTLTDLRETEQTPRDLSDHSALGPAAQRCAFRKALPKS
jgi:hypothetical protein